MELDPRCTYPLARSYVLKLHRDAHASSSGLAGRIENLASGMMNEFDSGAELLALLVAELEPSQRSCDGAERP